MRFICLVRITFIFHLENEKNQQENFLKEQLEEVYKYVEAKIILLDEWDANLDAVNQSQLSQLIDQIAQIKCVVEVRNR